MTTVINLFVSVLLVAMFYLIIGVLWQQAKLLIYGEIAPRAIDDVIALAFAIVLYKYSTLRRVKKGQVESL